MSGKKPTRQPLPSARSSLIDRGWGSLPDAVPDDTVLDPTVDSKELTRPDPSRRPADLPPSVPAVPLSSLGLPAPSVPGRKSEPKPEPAPVSKRVSEPPPPPSQRASAPPPSRRVSQPPPPPSRASRPPARPSHPPPRPSHPPPPPSRSAAPPPDDPRPPQHSESSTIVTASVELEQVAPPAAPAVGVPVSAVPAAAPPVDAPVSAPAAQAEAHSPAVAGFVLDSPANGPPSVAPASLPPASLPPASLPPSLAPSDLSAPTLEQALRQRVRVGNGAGPLWAFLVIGVVASLAIVSLVSALFSSVIARSTAPKREARPSAPIASSAPVEAPAPPAPPPPARAPTPSLLERAAQGEPDAVREIEKQPEPSRSVEQVSALAAARAEEKQRALRALPGRAEKDAVFASSAELAHDLRAAVGDPDTNRIAVTVMAQLPGSLGPDLLYATRSSRKKGDPAGELAEALLRTEVVRKKASPALLVVLDLGAASSCEAAKEALARCVEHGDRRALTAMARFRAKTGCGDLKNEDCFDCLREGDELKDATRAAAKRPAPRW